MVFFFRTLYIIGPILLFVLYFFHQEATKNVITSINSVQGQEGWVQINQGKEETAGDTIRIFLRTFTDENSSSTVNTIIDETGFQIDRVITFIEYYWAWTAIVLFLLFGLYICLGVKIYD
jgi:hypothetical protein